MAKTACEEAAELLSDDYGIVGLSARKRLTTHPDARNKLSKRLRAEGRELRRLRKLMLKAGDPEHAVIDPDEFEREAARIQKARKK